MSSITNLNLAISTFGYGEASLFLFIKALVEKEKSCYSDEIKVRGTEVEVSKNVVKCFEDRKWVCGLVGDDDSSYISLYPTSIATLPRAMVVVTESGGRSCTVKIHGSREVVDNVKEILSLYLSLVSPARIHWYYGSDCRSTTVPISNNNLPLTEMYPHLPCPLEEYYDNYIKSNSSVLILIGPPGTGKTSFLRGLLHHTQSSATVSYDPKILEDDTVFVNFISGGDKFMVLEDADSFLSSRSKGNTLMHKFLNIGDGLVSSKEKKIIFTTNLPSTRDIDPALTRPGRCFDILHFDKLSPEDCGRVMGVMGIQGETPASSTTLAELLSTPHTPSTSKSVGFI
jgi:hypothetical protein